MIANICAFLLYCFAITSNIKTTESAGNQVTPVQFFYPLCTGWYVNTVDRLKTYSKHPVAIKTAEQNILSGSCDNYKGIKLKTKIRAKLETKVQDIKCSFCAIAKTNILFLTIVVDRLRSGEPYIVDGDIVERLKEEAGIVVHLLLFGNMETDKWLWMYYLKIIALSRYDENKRFIRENPFEDDQLQTGVSDFIEYCKAEKYLPSAKTTVDYVLKNPKVYKNMFSVLRTSESIIGILLDRDFFSIDFLYLKPFWEDKRLLFGQITGARVDWSQAKHRFELEVAVTREFVKNRTWIYEPYGRLDHQLLLVKIIDARIFCHVSVILQLYEKQLSMLDEQTLTHIRELINNVLLEVVKFLSFKDDFLLNILSEFMYAQVKDENHITDISARVLTKANDSLNDLNGDEKVEIDWIGFSQRQLSTDVFMIKVINELDDYLNDFASFVRFEYKVFLHFIGVVKPKTHY
ncbi:uncharacterized protein LOC126836706 [Adelges cooleyi]|uniref:uncharacterized protein LOC126836706 n=1 Tax=Adelges cooleyi TaxID=133065 RepID=UPI00217FC1A6|nr:uncharacterized protein LOC126836706 [Adelges cooleyi]